MQPFYNLGKAGARQEVKLRTHTTGTRIPVRTKKERFFFVLRSLAG